MIFQLGKHSRITETHSKPNRQWVGRRRIFQLNLVGRQGLGGGAEDGMGRDETNSISNELLYIRIVSKLTLAGITYQHMLYLLSSNEWVSSRHNLSLNHLSEELNVGAKISLLSVNQMSFNSLNINK